MKLLVTLLGFIRLVGPRCPAVFHLVIVRLGIRTVFNYMSGDRPIGLIGTKFLARGHASSTATHLERGTLKMPTNCINTEFNYAAQSRYLPRLPKDTVRYRTLAPRVILHDRLVSPGSGALYLEAFGSCSAVLSGDLQFATLTLV